MCDYYVQLTLYLHRLIPLHKRVVAGKRIAIEKFVVEKSRRYLQQNTQLPVPALVCTCTYIGVDIVHSTLYIVQCVIEYCIVCVTSPMSTCTGYFYFYLNT